MGGRSAAALARRRGLRKRREKKEGHALAKVGDQQRLGAVRIAYRHGVTGDETMKQILRPGTGRWLFGLLLLPLIGFGHHSQFGRYDTDRISELEGEITRVQWRNPHVIFWLNVTGMTVKKSSGGSRQRP